MLLVNANFWIRLRGSSQHQVGGEWFEIKLGKNSIKQLKYEVLPNRNVISVCLHYTLRGTLKFIFKMRKIEENTRWTGLPLELINQS